MIQRIQSVYLFISAILGVVCLCRPLGYFSSAEGIRLSDFYNLWFRMSDSGAHTFTPMALFVLLLIATTLTILAIFLFNRRALQMRVAVFCMILLVGYYAYLGFLLYMAHADGCAYTPSVTAAFPFVCIVLDYLAFRGILKDELKIRSLDRLR